MEQFSLQSSDFTSHVYSLSALMHPPLLTKRGRSMAPRSRQVMLSCPSSLQNHSDFPTPITPLLPVLSSLTGVYHSRNSVETLGSQVPHHYLSPHAIGHTPGPLQVHKPFTSLQTLAFSNYREDRRVFRHRRIFPPPNSPSYTCPGIAYEAAPFAFKLRPAALAGTPG